MTREELYRLQVSATAALLLSAMRKGVLDDLLSRQENGPAPEGNQAVPHAASSSLARPAPGVEAPATRGGL